MKTEKTKLWQKYLLKTFYKSFPLILLAIIGVFTDAFGYLIENVGSEVRKLGEKGMNMFEKFRDKWEKDNPDIFNK